MIASNSAIKMQLLSHKRKTLGWLDVALICLLLGSFLSLLIGVTAPILQVQKRVVFSLIGMHIPVLDVKKDVSILGTVHDLFFSDGLVLGLTILIASFILPGMKMIAVGLVWAQWRLQGFQSGKALHALGIATKWSLTEPVVLGITVVACKLSADLKVTLAHGSVFFIFSIFGSILAAEVVKRTITHTPN